MTVDAEFFDPYEGEGEAGIAENIPDAVLGRDENGRHFATLPIAHGKVTAHGQTPNEACQKALILRDRANDNFKPLEAE